MRLLADGYKAIAEGFATMCGARRKPVDYYKLIRRTDADAIRRDWERVGEAMWAPFGGKPKQK